MADQESLSTNHRREIDDALSVDGAASLLSGRYYSERPPTPTSAMNTSLGEDDTPFVHVEEKNRTCVSPALSTSSSMTTSVGPTAATLKLLCQAIQQNGPRPPGLSLEEKAVWDAMQFARRQARQEGLAHAKEEHGLNTSHFSVDTSWDTRFVDIQEQAVLQQRDNSRSLQAIQRMLADVQAERDQAVLRLQDYQHQGNIVLHHEDPAGSCASSASNYAAEERETMQRDLEAMSARIVSLEQELSRSAEPDIKVTIQPYGADSPVSALQQVTEDELMREVIDQLEREKEALAQELGWKDKEIGRLAQELAEWKLRSSNSIDSSDTAASIMSTLKVNSDQLDSVRKELAEKSSALENAKMIITSLENASGSLAADLRRKLRQRDEDMAQVQKELSEKQRTLDTLATELRDLQKVKAAVVPMHNTEAAQVRRLQLSSRLENNLAEIRAAAVILESTQDATAVSDLSELLTDSANALKEGIDVIEHGVAEERRGPMRLHRELEEKKMAFQRLDDIHRKQAAEAARFKATTEDAIRRRDDEINALHAEIKILRQQCNTNLEVLTRKERELAVLRDSLQVEDDGVGYISDDEPDEEEQVSLPSPPSTATHQMSSEYGPSQVEALATLLSHGGNHSFDSGSVHTGSALPPFTNEQRSKELESLKVDLQKARTDFEKAQRQLKVEHESLSNAKMIISSLERANKSMMEDLRARLQDSNTAIASLLEKSMESEKTNAKLRTQLDAFKRTRQVEVEATALAVAPPPTPLLLTETID